MKIQKLLMKSIIVALVLGVSGMAFLGTSGSATAQTPAPRNCDSDGTVSRATVVGDLVIRGDCIVYLTTVSGNLRVIGNNGSNVVILRDVVVGGHIRVNGGHLIMRDNIVALGNVVVRNTTNANVSDTLVHSGNMRFEGNSKVRVISNFVGDGNIRCANNVNQATGERDEFASQNNVPNGVVTCFGQ